MLMEVEATATFDVDAGGEPSETVIELVADLENVNPVELSPPLYSTVDPDALDSLFPASPSGSPQTAGQVRFQYCGYEIHVRNDGEITVLNH